MGHRSCFQGIYRLCVKIQPEEERGLERGSRSGSRGFQQGQGPGTAVT